MLDMVLHGVTMLMVDFGMEHKISLDGLSEKECEEAVEKLIKQEPTR
jgi:hypothetical protein